MPAMTGRNTSPFGAAHQTFTASPTILCAATCSSMLSRPTMHPRQTVQTKRSIYGFSDFRVKADGPHA
jgi:hypothetical protein